MMAKKKIGKLPKYDEWLHDSLLDTDAAQNYLQSALGDFQSSGEMSCLLLAIRDVVKARGGMALLAENVRRGQLNKTVQRSPQDRKRLLQINGDPHLCIVE